MTTFSETLKERIFSMKKHFRSGAMRSLAERRRALEDLENMVIQNQGMIAEALKKDLGKSESEAFVSEIAFTIEEIRFTKKHLKKWMKPQKKKGALALWPSRSRLHAEPLGVCLIIGPWNYPFQLAVAPLIGAIAAGNCAIIKPSELTPHTANLLDDLVRKTFNKDLVHVIQGGVEETTELLEQPFDHIFFTGSTPVGKIIMKAASAHLTPVTLELGGKSPVFVHKDADLDLAARRIVWGKLYNCGQTCVAPDYLLVHSDVKKDLLEKMVREIEKQYGKSPLENPDYGNILNSRNFKRLTSMIDPSKIYHGGQSFEDKLYIEPTLMTDVTWLDAVMSEEIFGPILPVIEYSDLNEAFLLVKEQDKPLAAYFFSESKEHQNQFVEHLSFGGGCINDVLVHLTNPNLPFGGVGASGMGGYHGEYSFKTFSHYKSVVQRFRYFDLDLRYPPYSKKKLSRLRRLLRLN